MKAILINPKEKTVEEVEYDGHLAGMYKLLECQTICGAGEVRNGDVLYADDEGLFVEEKHYTYISKQVLVGNLLVCGLGKNGETTDVSCTADEIRGQLVFISEQEAVTIARSRGI